MSVSTRSRLLATFAFPMALIVGVQSGSLAQEPTPATEACPTTTEDENLALIATYFDAVANGDTATIDRILNEDYSDNISDTNEPGNADEIARFLARGVADMMLAQSLASGSWVAYSFSFSVGGTDTVKAIGISRFECGGVAESHFEYEQTAAES